MCARVRSTHAERREARWDFAEDCFCARADKLMRRTIARAARAELRIDGVPWCPYRCLHSADLYSTRMDAAQHALAVDVSLTLRAPSERTKAFTAYTLHGGRLCLRQAGAEF